MAFQCHMTDPIKFGIFQPPTLSFLGAEILKALKREVINFIRFIFHRFTLKTTAEVFQMF